MSDRTCAVCGVNPPAPDDDACEPCHGETAAAWLLMVANAERAAA